MDMSLECVRSSKLQRLLLPIYGWGGSVQCVRMDKECTIDGDMHVSLCAYFLVLIDIPLSQTMSVYASPISRDHQVHYFWFLRQHVGHVQTAAHAKRDLGRGAHHV